MTAGQRLISEFYNSLTDAGFESIISAPAEDQSGTGSSDRKPEDVGKKGCQFKSCAPNSPAIGKNASEPRFNYVNSCPVTSIRHGIDTLSPNFFGGPPDIAVSGPNVGLNTDITVPWSGTVGAATEAAKLGIPAIAFSGETGEKTAWDKHVKPYMQVYAGLATTVAQTLTGSEKPYLPEGIWLNVNFPSYSDKCNHVSKFRFVLSRIYEAEPSVGPDDVETCGSKRLPSELKVLETGGCYVSVSVANTEKEDVGAQSQAFVLQKLRSILSCLPKDD